MVPLTDVNVVLSLKPRQCSHCQHPLAEEYTKPHRRQVIELPPVKPIVRAYQVHRLRCPIRVAPSPLQMSLLGCRQGRWAGVQAITALGTGIYHLSKPTAQSVMEDRFGFPMSLGTMANLERATAQAYGQAQPIAYLDETGWRQS